MSFLFSSLSPPCLELLLHCLSFVIGMGRLEIKLLLVLRNCTLCSFKVYIHKIKQAEAQMLNAPDPPAEETK